MPGKDNRFPKEVRLRLRKEIEQLFNEGKVILESPVRAIYKFIPGNNHPVQAGVAVSKKSFKKAVDRNRIKRQMREAFRLNCHQVYEHFAQKGVTVHIMFVFTGTVSPEYAVLESKIILILQRLQEKHERSAD